MRRLLAILSLILLVSLSVAPVVTAAGEQASGTFIDSAGNPIGFAELEQLADGSVQVTVVLHDASVVKPGLHGIHFHAVGTCDPPDFTSAGGHFNPTNQQHGLENPQGPHAGDLPNLPIDASTRNANGTYTATITTNRITLSPGPTSIFDADGTALVIHAGTDDQKSDPAGNSGARVACAVLNQGAATPGLPNTGGGFASTRHLVWEGLLLGVLLLGIAVLTKTALRPGKR